MNKFIISKKLYRNELATFYSFLIGFLIAIVIGSIILLIQSKNPFDVFSLMLKLSIGSVNSLSNSLNKAIPLILAGLGIAIINSVKLWNIGAEGQIFFGAIALNFVYINTSIENSYLYIFLLLVSGFIGGSVCILLPAFLDLTMLNLTVCWPFIAAAAPRPMKFWAFPPILTMQR